VFGQQHRAVHDKCLGSSTEQCMISVWEGNKIMSEKLLGNKVALF